MISTPTGEAARLRKPLGQLKLLNTQTFNLMNTAVTRRNLAFHALERALNSAEVSMAATLETAVRYWEGKARLHAEKIGVAVIRSAERPGVITTDLFVRWFGAE